MRRPVDSHRSRNPRPRRGGFTLLEMVFGLTVMGILASAMVASIAIAARTLEEEASPVARAAVASGILEGINAELAEATQFAERAADAVTFVVPDRDGDHADEVIRYAWSGPPDYRLTRQYNDQLAVVVAEDVRHFRVTYGLRIVGPSP